LHDQIDEIHTFIKNELNVKKNKIVKVLYGGSVNVINANQIMSINNVDGVLIGGASLNVKDFLAIYSSAVKQINMFS
jgi:triosephosphate isomerase